MRDARLWRSNKTTWLLVPRRLPRLKGHEVVAVKTGEFLLGLDEESEHMDGGTRWSWAWHPERGECKAIAADWDPVWDEHTGEQNI